MPTYTARSASNSPCSGLALAGLLCVLLLTLLVGCAAPQQTTSATPTAGGQSWSPPAQATWQEVQLPGKTATAYQLDANAPAGQGAQRTALKADAQSSASMLRAPVRIEAGALGRIDFSWLVPALIANADVGQRERDDSPARLILAFEGDRSTFSPKNAMLNELARMLTGEEMPYATLMYVWCNQRPVDSVILSPRTDRIRKIVVESGSQGLAQWRHYERDVRADYVRAFGKEPGALVAIGLMTDSDNTRSNTVAWYGPIALR
jgi:hypothetical protein